ncbi:MAG: helix-turn-helix domain-containing protein [Alphaproteobacteria bacterium]
MQAPCQKRGITALFHGKKGSMIYITEENERFAPLLQKALESYGLDKVRVGKAGQHEAGSMVIDAQSHAALQKPLVFGALVDRLLSLENDDYYETMEIGPFSLDLIGNFIHFQNGQSVKLTDKERDIVTTLAQCAPKSMARQELLEKIWGYKEGIDTHTLETHIYRLRQKLEDSAAEPFYLKTTEEGYKLDI